MIVGGVGITKRYDYLATKGAGTSFPKPGSPKRTVRMNEKFHLVGKSPKRQLKSLGTDTLEEEKNQLEIP